MAEKRTELVRVRLTERQKEYLEAEAEAIGFTVSEYIRWKCFTFGPPYRPEDDALLNVRY